MNIFLKYILFCIVAAFVNLATQRISLKIIFVDHYFVALLIGTLSGLFTKFFLDKNYIFNDFDHSLKNNSKKFTLYSFNGICTTFIFWGTESLFYFVFATDFARELGAVIGLSIGYVLKYRLDKKIVFKGYYA
jgi:putative flippase GtrA